METIRYNRRNVYTQSDREIIKRELETAQIDTGNIEEAYLFTVDSERRINKVDFNRKKIDANNSGLYVRVKDKRGIASVSISRLDRIVGFMVDSECLGKDLSTLKGKPVTAYINGMCLLGISIPAKKRNKLPSIPSDSQYHPASHKKTTTRVH